MYKLGGTGIKKITDSLSTRLAKQVVVMGVVFRGRVVAVHEAQP